MRLPLCGMRPLSPTVLLLSSRHSTGTDPLAKFTTKYNSLFKFFQFVAQDSAQDLICLRSCLNFINFRIHHSFSVTFSSIGFRPRIYMRTYADLHPPRPFISVFHITVSFHPVSSLHTPSSPFPLSQGSTSFVKKRFKQVNKKTIKPNPSQDFSMMCLPTPRPPTLSVKLVNPPPHPQSFPTFPQSRLWPDWSWDTVTPSLHWYRDTSSCVVYYEMMKRELKRRPIHECRCDERLEGTDEGSTRLVYTELSGGLEHLKIETRLTDERFASVMGACVI